MAESGLGGYGEEEPVAELSFGIAEGLTNWSIGFNVAIRDTHTFAHQSKMIV